jgi:hypothetical protein
MIPQGYMAKRVSPATAWLQNDQVAEILSVSPHLSEDFAEWTGHWNHNGYWFFNSPDIITDLIGEWGGRLEPLRWFYYEGYELAYDEETKLWSDYGPEPSFGTAVVAPRESVLRGFDVVTYSQGNRAECSPLSCNALAANMEVNRHCLFTSFAEAKQKIEERYFTLSEPGPFRILAVYEIFPQG